MARPLCRSVVCTLCAAALCLSLQKTEFGRRLALLYAHAEGILPAGVLPSGPGVPIATSGAGGVILAYGDPTGTAAGLALTPTTDCRTTQRIPPPANATAAVCCQTEAGSGASWPFELRLADNATFVLATATIDTTHAGVVMLTPNATSDVGPFTGVRYAWQGFPLCLLTNAQGLPSAPFVINLSL